MIEREKVGRRFGWWVRIPVAGFFLAAALSAAGQTAPKKPEEIYLGGKPGAPVKIEVFSDYQCPVCRTFYLESLKPLLLHYMKAGKIDQIAIQYHDLPLDSIHQHARKATRYAIAALRMGKDKWLKVSDALYMQQAVWSEDGNIEGALEKMLDPAEMAQLKKLVTDPSIDEAIKGEVLLAQSRNINSTPTVFVIQETGRQQRATGNIPFEILRDYIDKLLK